MANQVRVTSLDALETFRAHLIIFLAKAIGSVDEVGDEVRRMRFWVQNDRRTHWETQIRKCRRTLEQAQQEFLSARLSGLRDTTAVQQAAVLKAKRALAEAEEKLRNVKAWSRNFEGAVDPLMKGLSSLRQFLDYEMPKAVAFLVQAQKTLEAYTQISAPETVASSPTPVSPDASPETAGSSPV